MSCLSLFRRMRDEERTREARIVVDFIWEKPQPSISDPASLFWNFDM
jgi:hypothetical protein